MIDKKHISCFIATLLFFGFLYQITGITLKIDNNELRHDRISIIQNLDNSSDLVPEISNWTHWENQSWYNDPVIPNQDSVVWIIENDLLNIDYGNFEMQYKNPLLVEGEYHPDKEQWVI
ncbi:MAG: hypothetical protein GF329_15650 [Candidatus Lokiarchaeota archaeon]|nr:hypothetical protein [Candidatus Lokiarchaeota archaeon]